MRKHKYLVITGIMLVALAAGAATLDSLTRGNKPTGRQQPLCSTSPTAAAFESAATCGLAGSANAPTGVQPLCGYPDAGSAYGTPLTCGLAVSSNAPSAGGSALCTYPDAGAAFDTPANCFPSSLTVPTVTTTTSLVVGSTGTAITGSYRGTIVSPGAQAANSCGVAAITVTGANVGAECVVGLPSSFTSTVNLYFDCYVSAANTVQFRQCNNTAGSLIPPAGTYSVRVFNP